MKKKSLIFLILLIVKEFVFSQTTDFRTPVIPPSPTSSVFVKYGNDKPALQSGTVNIPISLFNIEAGGLTIPFSLTYQTSGINVMDTPYPAGYGWVFSSGFRITRTIYGRPDELFRYKDLSNQSYDSDTLKKGIVDDQIANMHLLSQSDLYDTQKDVFTISLPSGSYKFFINKVANRFRAVSIGNNLKIDLFSTENPDIRVTDDKGIIYRFGSDSNINSEKYEESEGSQSWRTTWALREIILPNGKKISFTWKNVTINSYSVRYNTPISVIDYKNYRCYDDNNTGVEVHDQGGMTAPSDYRYPYVLMLSKVEFPDGVVDLTYKSDQNPFLEQITIRNKNDEVVKTITLGRDPSSLAEQALLRSLDINGEKYTFSYNENRFSKNSTSLDYWGYYNGKNNVSLIPKMRLNLFQGITFGNTSLPPNINLEVGYADRSVNAEYMKAYILTRIDYPTGGYSQYEYQPHKFAGHPVHSNGLFTNDPAPLTEGGGLRVSQITTYSSDNSANPTVKTYKYGPNENGMAHAVLVPTPDTFVDEIFQSNQVIRNEICATDLYGNRMLTINAFSNYSKFLVDRNSIWYSTVTEYVNDQKTEYDFAYQDDSVSWVPNYIMTKTPYVFRYNNFFNNGPRLIKEIVYKKQGGNYTPVKKMENEYEIYKFQDKDLSNVIIDRKGIINYLSLQGIDFYDMSIPGILYMYYFSPSSFDYRTLNYMISAQYDRLKNIHTRTYSNSDSVSTDEEYVYDDYYQLHRNIKYSSIEGKPVTTEYKYPYNFVEPIYTEMISQNMVSPVIEETTFKGQVVIKRIKTNYLNDPVITNGLILPSSIQSAYSATATPVTEVTYDRYDALGNIIQLRIKNGLPQSYIWGYNGRYPVAEVKNAAFDQVKNILGGDVVISQLNEVNPSDSFVKQKMQLVRSGLPKSLVSSYTYKPLVGVTCMTDAKGKNSYFNYDDSGRLIAQKNNDSAPLNNYLYHYSDVNRRFTNSKTLAKEALRSNCPTGYSSTSPVTFTVLAGSIFSTISQEDANQKALDYLNANVQGYADAHGSCSQVFYNKAVSGSFTKNNCPPGYPAGPPVSYTVPERTYSSFISQADADAHAQNNVNTNGQAYANIHGTCGSVYFNTAKGGYFTRNNCATGSTSTDPVWYSVPTNTYSSLISQADADAKAQHDVDINGQSYANAHGLCQTLVGFTITKYMYSGTIQSVAFYKDGTPFMAFTPSNNGNSESFQIPEGTYTVRFYLTDDPDGPRYVRYTKNGSNAVCSQIVNSFVELQNIVVGGNYCEFAVQDFCN